MIELEQLWLGSLQSYLVALDKFSSYREIFLSGIGNTKSVGTVYRANEDDDEDEQKPPYKLVDDVAIIDIRGSLIPESNWITKLFGMSSYEDIRFALQSAEADSKVGSILLNINSPGGAVTGVQETGDLIRKIGDTKRVEAVSSGMMASGAYWLGSAAEKITVSGLATVGSIGVISVHQEITKMLEQDGIKATVMREGRYKALGNPFEVLTPEAKEIIQDRMRVVYDTFVSTVASNRKMVESDLRKEGADGKEYFGFEAKRVGLVDDIGNLGSVLSTLRKSVPTTSTTRIGTEVLQMNEDELSAEQEALAALAAGADEGGVAAQPESPAEPAVEAPAPAQPVEQTATSNAEVLKLHKDLMAAEMQISRLTSENEALVSQVGNLRVVAEQTVHRLQIALKAPTLDLSKFDVNALLSTYESLQTEFQKQYKVGQQARTKIEPTRPVGSVTATGRLEEARLQAVR